MTFIEKIDQLSLDEKHKQEILSICEMYFISGMAFGRCFPQCNNVAFLTSEKFRYVLKETQSNPLF